MPHQGVDTRSDKYEPWLLPPYGRIACARSIAVLRLSGQASETGLRGNNIHRSNSLVKIFNSLLAAQKFPARSAGSSSQAIDVTHFSVAKLAFKRHLSKNF